MPVITRRQLNNKIKSVYSGATTTVQVLASDSTAYATHVLLKAAGKKTFPGLDDGSPAPEVVLETDNGSGAAAAGAVYYAANRSDTNAPVADTDFDGVIEPGQSVLEVDVRQLWFRKANAADRLFAKAAY